MVYVLGKGWNQGGTEMLLLLVCLRRPKQNEYDEYIKQIKPIVESYGGKYLVRTEEIFSLSENRKPDRVIVIQLMMEGI